MSQALKWLLPIVAFLFIVGIARAQFSMAAGERDAIHREGIAEGYRRQRAISEPVLAAEMERYAEQVVITHTLQDSVDVAVRGAVRERLRAAALSDTLRSHVRAVAGDSVAVVALVDSLVVAHADEIHAVETRLAVTMTMNEALWRRIDIADAIIEQHIAANELLRLEVEAWEQTSASWQRAYRAGFLQRIVDNIELVAVSVGTGAVACLVFCR